MEVVTWSQQLQSRFLHVYIWQYNGKFVNYFQFSVLPLKELYCEENPLLQHVPVHSVQEEEVLSLKEYTARYVMKELKDR